MCKHDCITVNDIKVCRRCGMTIMPDGKIMFDRKYANIGNTKRRKKNAKNRK